MKSVRGSLGLGETGSQLDFRKFPGSGLGILVNTTLLYNSPHVCYIYGVFVGQEVVMDFLSALNQTDSK